MEPLVQVSLSEAQTAGILGPSFRPDSIIGLQSDPFSGVLCIEVDEATQRSAVIRSKLDAYAVHLRARAGWHVLFVVPSRDRLEWLRRATGWNHWPALVGRCWGAVLPELRIMGADAVATPVACRGEPRPLIAVLNDPRPRRCPTPVGSDEWVEPRHRWGRGRQRGAPMTRERTRRPSLTPAERSLRARIGAYAMHARNDPRQTTAAAREAFLHRFVQKSTRTIVSRLRSASDAPRRLGRRTSVGCVSVREAAK
jgi:hypothetical protein